MCIRKEYCEAARSSEDRTKSSVYGGHGHKTPVSGSLLQSATIIFFSALSLQKDNPTLALCTLTYVWVLIKLCCALCPQWAFYDLHEIHRYALFEDRGFD